MTIVWFLVKLVISLQYISSERTKMVMVTFLLFDLLMHGHSSTFSSVGGKLLFPVRPLRSSSFGPGSSSFVRSLARSFVVHRRRCRPSWIF